MAFFEAFFNDCIFVICYFFFGVDIEACVDTGEGKLVESADVRDLLGTIRVDSLAGVLYYFAIWSILRLKSSPDLSPPDKIPPKQIIWES